MTPAQHQARCTRSLTLIRAIKASMRPRTPPICRCCRGVPVVLGCSSSLAHWRMERPADGWTNGDWARGAREGQRVHLSEQYTAFRTVSRVHAKLGRRARHGHPQSLLHSFQGGEHVHQAGEAAAELSLAPQHRQAAGATAAGRGKAEEAGQAQAQAAAARRVGGRETAATAGSEPEVLC